MLYTLKIKKRKKEYGKLLNRTRKTLVLIVLFFVAFGPSVSLAVSQQEQTQNNIDDANQTIKEYKESLKDVQDQKHTLELEVKNLDIEIVGVRSKIANTQNQINQTQAQINQTIKDIEQREIEIQKKKKVISELITELYKNSKTTSLEVLTTAQDLSDVLNKVEYNVAFEGKVREALTEIKNLKVQLEQLKISLEQKKVELESLMAQLKGQEASLNASLIAKNDLLALTKGQEAEYQKLLKEAYNKRAALIKQYNEIVSGGSSNYPWGNPAAVDGAGNPIYYADGLGYYVGECTSYVAWKWKTLGKPFVNTRPGQGSAYNWPNMAKDSPNNYSVSYNPVPGAIMVFPRPIYSGDLWGHVAFVENVNNNGTVDISEYNWATKHGYSFRKNVNPNNYNAVFVY